MQHAAMVVDHSAVDRTPDHPAQPTPPEGVVQMVCTELMDDPAQMQAYAVLAGQVDGFLESRGLHSWAALDVETFLAQSAGTSSEAATQCCMLATVLPWMVRAGDLCSSQASRKCVELLEVCPQDIQARSCIVRMMQRVCEAEMSAAGLFH